MKKLGFLVLLLVSLVASAFSENYLSLGFASPLTFDSKKTFDAYGYGGNLSYTRITEGGVLAFKFEFGAGGAVSNSSGFDESGYVIDFLAGFGAIVGEKGKSNLGVFAKAGFLHDSITGEMSYGSGSGRFTYKPVSGGTTTTYTTTVENSGSSTSSSNSESDMSSTLFVVALELDYNLRLAKNFGLFIGFDTIVGFGSNSLKVKTAGIEVEANSYTNIGFIPKAGINIIF